MTSAPHRTARSRVLVALVLAAVVAPVLPAAVPTAEAAPSNKVTICPRTSSTTNPYRRFTIAKTAVDGAGESDHTRHTGAPLDPHVA